VTTDDRLQEIDGKLQIGVMTFDACGLDVQEVPVSVDPNSSAAIWESEPLGSILVDAKKQCLVAMLEVRGEIIARDVYFARPLSEIEFPLPRLLVHREQLSETTHELVISADAYARNLVITNIPAESRPSDNCFDVLPGEQKTATIHNLTVEQANELKLNVGRTP
jgi:beta-mannosidase